MLIRQEFPEDPLQFYSGTIVHKGSKTKETANWHILFNRIVSSVPPPLRDVLPVNEKSTSGAGVLIPVNILKKLKKTNPVRLANKKTCPVRQANIKDQPRKAGRI